ncbi:hypothetical protein MOF7_16175 [Methylobacterium oryzae]
MEAEPGHLSDRHFRSVADLIQQHVGIQLPPAKRTMVEGRPRKRVRALELPTAGRRRRPGARPSSCPSDIWTSRSIALRGAVSPRATCPFARPAGRGAHPRG